MKTAEDFVAELPALWNGHPDDYDPTDDQLAALVRAVQADAIASAATSVFPPGIALKRDEDELLDEAEARIRALVVTP